MRAKPAIIASAIALLLTVPAAYALTREDYPEGPAKLSVFVRNLEDAGLIRLRIVDADGREVHDELEILPKDGGWGVGLDLPARSYAVTLVRLDGLWPFATHIENDGTIDLGTCEGQSGIVRFETAFRGADNAVTGPFVEC